MPRKAPWRGYSGGFAPAKRVVVDEISFASKAEAQRYTFLKAKERAGEIRALELQPRYKLTVNGEKVGTYVGDFRYIVDGKGIFVEDVKRVVTPVYELKKRLMKAIYLIDVYEIRKAAAPIGS